MIMNVRTGQISQYALSAESTVWRQEVWDQWKRVNPVMTLSAGQKESQAQGVEPSINVSSIPRDSMNLVGKITSLTDAWRYLLPGSTNNLENKDFVRSGRKQ